MNYTLLDDAYKIHHVKHTTYSGTLIYSPICIYCSYSQSIPLMKERDGGSFRQCISCKKHFKANILNPAISNFSSSTNHLKGTN